MGEGSIIMIDGTVYMGKTRVWLVWLGVYTHETEKKKKTLRMRLIYQSDNSELRCPFQQTLLSACKRVRLCTH